MAKIRIEHVSDDIRDVEQGIEGVAHLPPGDLTDAQTLCGLWNESSYEITEGAPTCAACISQAKAVFSSISKKELKSL